MTFLQCNSTRKLSKLYWDRARKAADVALVTCVLFVYYETLRGHHATAISHINGGIKILSASYQTASFSSPSPQPSRSRAHPTSAHQRSPSYSSTTTPKPPPSSLVVNVLSKTPPPTTPCQATHPRSRKNFKVWVFGRSHERSRLHPHGIV